MFLKNSDLTIPVMIKGGKKVFGEESF